MFFIVTVLSCDSSQSTDDSGSSFRPDSIKKDTITSDSISYRAVGWYDFSPFIPKHYLIKDSVIGNLNLDAFPDAILVLEHDDEDWMDERLRPVLILIGDSTGHFHLAVRNDSLTMPKVEGQMFGEPYNGCEIDSGRFVIRHYGGSRWRWTQDYEFNYDEKKNSWYFTSQFGSWMDMIGDPDTTTYRDTVIVKRKIDLRKFSGASTERMESPW